MLSIFLDFFVYFPAFTSVLLGFRNLAWWP